MVLTPFGGGGLIFLVLMYGVFYLTHALNGPCTGQEGFRLLRVLLDVWPGGWERNPFGCRRCCRGVGCLLVFAQYSVTFFRIALFEDTGYMARAAFIMDRFMHKIGLHGKSFIPMSWVWMFGSRHHGDPHSENRRDRLTTMMVIPLMSCGA